MVRSHARRSGISSVDDLESESVSTEYATTDTPVTTVYVRTGGDDANHGLSADYPVQSIEAALSRVNRLPVEDGNSPTAKIEFGGGETYTADNVEVAVPWVSRLLLTTDGGAATFAVPSGSTGLLPHRSRVELKDIRVEPADPNNLHNAAITAFDQSAVYARSGCVFYSGSGGFGNGLFEGYFSSYIYLMDGAEIDGANRDGPFGVVAHSGTHAGLYGTVSACDRAAYIDRGATSDVINPEIDNCGIGVLLEDQSAAKISGGAVTDCDAAIYSRSGSFGTIQDVSLVDLTDTQAKFVTESGGIYHDQETNTIHIGGETFQFGGKLGADEISVGTRTGLTMKPIYDATVTFASGETRTGFGPVRANNENDATSLGWPVFATAVPSNDPDNDHGYLVDSCYWENTDGQLKLRVSETENDGGGEARVTAYQITPS